jgi:hypothetical protein
VQVGRVLLVSLADVAVAAVVAVLVFRIFGAVSGADTRPPECYNAWGRVVGCSMTQSRLMLPTFGAVVLGLVAWHTSRWARRGP